MDATASSLPRSSAFLERLRDPDKAIGGPLLDALCFWGAPLLAAALVWLWADMAAMLPHQAGETAIAMLVGAIGILTFAHLIAVAPRAYLNRQVFASNRLRLTVVPVVLIAALFASPTLLLIGGVIAVFWDVHHTAMQNFGLGRIYDLKAGQGGSTLRRTDLILNWLMYVGPIGAGAALIVHLNELGRLSATPLALLTETAGLAAPELGHIRTAAFIAWAVGIAFALSAYAAERQRGYRVPPHKLALQVSTAATSIIAWAFSPPFVAFAIVNLFHAVQYFALVWLKEGKRMRIGLPAFLALCGGFGLAYFAAKSFNTLLAPFIACSLLHFWYDSFVWSVRKKQV